jgi:TonB family protein
MPGPPRNTVSVKILQGTVALLIAVSISTHAKPASKTKQERSESSGETQYIRLDHRFDYATAIRLFTAQWKAVFVYTPWPRYPKGGLTVTGTAIIRISVNRQGTVTNLQLLKSTGSQELDEASLKTLIQWRARPGPSREIDLPVTFTIGSFAERRIPAELGFDR